MSNQFELTEATVSWIDNKEAILDLAVPLSDLIVFGEYQQVDRHINEVYFQSEPHEVTRLPKLCSFGKDMSFNEVKDFFSSQDIRFATLRELLFLGSLLKALHRTYVIVIPGTTRSFPHLEGIYTPVLSISPHERIMRLDEPKDVFKKGTCFAVIEM